MAKQATILLVEDDIHDVELMRLAFEKASIPFALKSVSHGGEAIQYLSGEGHFADREKFPTPSLVLLDLKMPRVDGFDVLRWIQTQPAEKMPPVIVLSYSKLESDRRLAQELGAKGYVVKPVDFDSAVSFVKSLDSPPASGAAPTVP